MALDDFALEELGLAPRWVSKGAQAARVGTMVDEVPGGDVQSTPVSACAGEPEIASMVVRGADMPAVQAENAGADRPTARTGDLPARPARAADTVAAERAAPDMRSAETSAANVPITSDELPPTEDDFAWFDDTPAPSRPVGDEPASQPAEPRNDVATLDWDALSQCVTSCTRCRLCEKRTNTVFGVGDREADWMLIGEAPGENEDRQGEPFVGQAGKLLDNMLRALSLARGENVYIANVIKCRPPGNRNPEPDEVARCEPYLQRQVALVKPKIIVALGRFAAQSLLRSEGSIASLRSRVHEYEGVPVIVTYHPAYLLRSLHDKSKAWADLCLARDTLRAGRSDDGGEK
ncbi:uracil-DNA glycosylase [Paraburkholderia adhaesiva]|uniref:uracil-DNA glycosylase n=1 Tax=Paraburkholderia adhaesiva TaxID=2883244 RepID=UPI001F33A8B9|nr:uracil-DNA glycosylase [Paraburkholderia adhaesiva]